MCRKKGEFVEKRYWWIWFFIILELKLVYVPSKTSCPQFVQTLSVSRFPSQNLFLSEHFISYLPPPSSSLLPSSPPECNQGCEMSGQRKCSHISKGSGFLSGSGQEREKVKLNTVGEERGMRAGLWTTVINTSSREAAALKGHSEQEPILSCFVPYFLFEISIHCASLLRISRL